MTTTAETISKLAAALREARAFIVSELEVQLDSVTKPDAAGLPDRSTIAPSDRAVVQGFDDAIARIDAVLAEADTAA